jgi:predicted AlkP superfamily pyrophosphatase or phosphodiesterase
MSRLLMWFALVVVSCMPNALALGSPVAEHVFIISVDGGKPEVMARSHMPTLNRLVAEGASTWNALTIFPSITLPSHTSMLTGVAADKHHILWNTWQPAKGLVSVPTIFSEAKKAGFSTAMFVGKEKFRHLLQPGTVDFFAFDPTLAQMGSSTGEHPAKLKKRGTIPAREVAGEAARYIRDNKPNLCFIHFAAPDQAGHKYGWGSPEQVSALSEVDAALKEVIDAIESAGIRERAVVIVTADHGGHRKTHGLPISDDMFIPWIAWGAGVKTNTSISAAVATYDTGATALWLLGVQPPRSFDGKPVCAAFNVRNVLAVGQ